MIRKIAIGAVLVLIAIQVIACSSRPGIDGDPCVTDADCPVGQVCHQDLCVDASTVCGADTCNGHGACDDATGAVVCTCDEAYRGDRCQDCAAGYVDYGDGSCLPEDPCAEDTDCAALNRACVNEQGEAECGECLAGFHLEGEDCIADQTCAANSCAGHGACDDATGQVVCNCDEAYQGDHCEACAAGYSNWPVGSGTCADDPCDPDPCAALSEAVAGSCTQNDLETIGCDCNEGFGWDGAACAAECMDEDGDGYGDGPACSGTDCDDADPLVFEGAPELCDGVDNNCDDATDEELTTRACEQANEYGVCVGQESCAGAEGWIGCDASVPEAEACDDQDNDCDDATDEDYPDKGEPCDGADSDLCPNGTWTCSAAADGLQCVNEAVTDIPEICDGDDNDCDGSTDNDPVLPADPCENTVPDVGTCPGAWSCEGSDGWQCVAPTPGPDVCNGSDDDCDPNSADGDADPLNGADCDGPDGDLCPEGTYSCVDGVLVCSDTTTNDLDLCDGLDNDCDPNSADGDEDPLNGAVCDGPDGDLCPEGTYSCVDGALVCSDTMTNDLDLCDGLDNDCDPNSADGDEDPLNGAACDGPDGDLCPEGTFACVDGALVCSDASADDLDICDGLDNDCDPISPDGSEDPLNGAACDGPDSDRCQEGTYSCGPGGLICSDNSGDDLDLCNGDTNDDCDPISPDGSGDPLNGAACDGPDGDLCQEGIYSCGPGGLICSDNTADNIEACNGADDDCDGETDEGPEICGNLQDDDCDGMTDEGC